MVTRFAGFDEYQLGKYNKGASATDKASSKICFTLKQLIRKLHIVSPVSHVLGILGKRYPETFQEFTAMRMEGAFDSTRAGERMKLPVPETWETQVSLNGNCAATWQTLLENRKLPFMAMLRNLRNMLLAQMEPKCVPPHNTPMCLQHPHSHRPCALHITQVALRGTTRDTTLTTSHSRSWIPYVLPSHPLAATGIIARC
jgi:hypothetical protein